MKVVPIFTFREGGVVPSLLRYFIVKIHMRDTATCDLLLGRWGYVIFNKGGISLGGLSE